MNFELLQQVCGSLVRLNDQEWERFKTAFSSRKVNKKTLLVKSGQICKEIYFINKGLLRLFYDKEDLEITAFIFKEGLFATSYDSFLKQSPGIQNLEAIEDSELLVISFDELNKLYEEIPAMHIFTRKMAEQRFINAQNILSSFILDSPETRYYKFEKEHPDLLLRVPHHLIASFLGITPVSMSRIRARKKS